MKKPKLFIIVLIIIAICIVGYLNKSKMSFLLGKKVSPSPILTKVKVGYMPFTTNWVMFLALEKGMFKAEGLDVEPISFTSGTDAANALAKGEIAVHAINTYTDLFNIESRTPGTFKLLIVQQVSNQASNEALIVRKDSLIKNVRQLTDKKIGVTPGIFTEAMVKKAYEKDIEFTKGTQIIKLPPQSQLIALENGQIDALLAYEPTITIGLKKGTIAVLEDHPWKRVQEPFPIGGYTISTKFMNVNPQITKKIANVLLHSLEYGTKNQSEVIKATAKFTNMTEDLVGQLRWNENIPVSTLPQEYFTNVANLYYDLGQVETKVNASGFGYAN